MARTIRRIKQEELDQIKERPDFTSLIDSYGMEVICPACSSENSAVFDINDICQKCGHSLLTGDVLVGLLPGEEIWLVRN